MLEPKGLRIFSDLGAIFSDILNIHCFSMAYPRSLMPIGCSTRDFGTHFGTPPPSRVSSAPLPPPPLLSPFPDPSHPPNRCGQIIDGRWSMASQSVSLSSRTAHMRYLQNTPPSDIYQGSSKASPSAGFASSTPGPPSTAGAQVESRCDGNT